MAGGNELTKLTRWIIPGWLALLAFYAFIVINIFFTSEGQDKLYPSVALFFSSMSTVDAVLAAFTVAASGAPLGFLIYQVYFFLRWNSPFSRDGLLPPLITGRQNDINLILRDIEPEELANANQWRKDWVGHSYFERDHGFRWRYIELFFMEVAQKIDSKYEGLSIFERHRYLHEIMHTLGASIVAIYVGFFGFLFVVDYRKNIFLPTYFVVTFIATFILFFFLNRENQAKENMNSGDELGLSRVNDPIPAIAIKVGPIRFLICSPGSLYISSLIFVFIFGNPLFGSSLNIFRIAITIFLSILLISVWVLSKSKCSREYWLGDLLWLGVTFLISIFIWVLPHDYLSWVDWPFLTTLLIFLMANLVLFQNRQNVRDDMLAMEYYTLRRYLAEDPIEAP